MGAYVDVFSGTEISGDVIRLIEGAKSYVVLICPYFDPWDRLVTEIRRAVVRPVNVVLLVRGGTDRAKQETTTADLAHHGVKVMFLAKLHAKVYFNESEAIVTSMNLLKSSALDSWEIAMRAGAEDSHSYGQIVAHAKKLLDRAADEARMLPADPTRAARAKEVRPGTRTEDRISDTAKSGLVEMLRGMSGTAAPVPRTPARRRAGAAVPAGHCIRCAESIVLDVDRPFCATCYRVWKEYENAQYKEIFCHACGKERAVTAAKPRCHSCWQAAQT